MDASGEEGRQRCVPRQGPQEAGLALHTRYLGGHLLLFSSDLRIQSIGGLLQLCLHGLQLILLGADLANELIYFCLLGLPLLLGGLLLLAGFLLGGFGLLQFSLVHLYLLPDGNQVVHDLVIILHDLFHHHEVVQQIAEVSGGKQDGPVGHLALLLHIANTAAEQIVLLRLVRLRLGQLHLLLLDELAVFLDLSSHVVYFFLNHVDLPLDQVLLLLGGVLVRPNVLQLGL